MPLAAVAEEVQAIAYEDLPENCRKILAAGGANEWAKVREVIDLLPYDRNTVYRQLKRYADRMQRERMKRGSYLLPPEVLDAWGNELPCDRGGGERGGYVLPKRRLVERLLGCRVEWPRADS